MLLKREHALGQGESESDQPLGPVVRHSLVTSARIGVATDAV
jgi:hypothetical protein